MSFLYYIDTSFLREVANNHWKQFYTSMIGGVSNHGDKMSIGKFCFQLQQHSMLFCGDPNLYVK